MFKSLNFSLFDLIDDNLSPIQCFQFFLLNFFILLLDLFQSFHFHHSIFFNLLSFIVLPLIFFMFELFISDCSYFSIINHFIHCFNFINMLMGIVDCFIIDFLSLMLFFLLKFIQRKFLFLLLFKPQHFFFLKFGFS